MTETKNDVCHDDTDESHPRMIAACSFDKTHAAASANDSIDISLSKSTMPDESPERHNIL